MTRKLRLLITGAALLALWAGIVAILPDIRSEWKKAQIMRTIDDLSTIATAVESYRTAHGAVPQRLAELCPAFLASNVLYRPAVHVWLGRDLLVPANPYGVEFSASNTIITCQWADGSECTHPIGAPVLEVQWRRAQQSAASLPLAPRKGPSEFAR